MLSTVTNIPAIIASCIIAFFLVQIPRGYALAIGVIIVILLAMFVG